MPNKEFNNVQLDVTFIQAATRSNITSGEDIATSFGKISKWFTDLKSIAWDGHPTVTQKDTTSTVSPNPEETFTVVDSVTRNGEGHVTGINVKTVKLPTGSGYVHPTHDSHTSGLYKITVDELGHVSDATAVTKTDITDLGIPESDTNTTYTLSGAYGSSSNTWVTTLTPSSGSVMTSTVPTASTTAYGITKLSTATNSTSTSLAATASAVKAAYDKANHSHPYLPLAGGTMDTNAKIITQISNDNRKTHINGGGIRHILPSDVVFAMGSYWYTDDNYSNFLGSIGAYGKNNDIEYFYVGGTHSAPLFKVTKSDGSGTFKGGVTATTFNGYTLAAACAKGIINNTSVSPIGWVSKTESATVVPTINAIAYWNGAHSVGSTASNLAYCNKGAFGTAATKGVDTTVTSGSSNLITSGGVYTKLGSYLPLSGGTVTGTTTFSQADYAGQLKINRASTATGVMSCIDYLVNNSRVGILGFDNNSKLYIRNANTSNMDMLTVDSSGNGVFTGEITASKLNSSLDTTTYLAGNRGKAIINSSASAGSYTMLAKMNSTNGVFTHGVYTTGYLLQYTANSTISAGTNAVTKSVRLLDESGNSSFPGTVTATTFAGALSGNATTATRLVVGSVTVQTGSTKKAKITLETLMSWLITKGHIPSNTNCYRVINIGWQYSNNDILQLTTTTATGTTKYELQLAGVTIEFIGSATNYNTGVFRLRIHSAPTNDNFALTSGYNRFPVSHIAEYYCNGSEYSPTWKVLSSMGDGEAYNVTQSNTTTSNYRAILMGYNNSTDVSTLTTTVTNQVMASSSIYAQPSTGTLYASKYNGYKVRGTSGNWFSSIPVIRSDGVMEAGKYIDFHTTNTGTTDYDVRLTAGSGTLTCSGSISATSFSGNATSASKVNNSLKINNKTFDGSSAVDVGTIGIGYGGTGSTTAAGARGNLGAMASISANGYYGMGTPNGATDQWIRTTSVGIIPYQAGSAGSGHCSIGTNTWYFQKAFIDTVYGTLSGNASSASKLATARTITLGSGLQGSVSFDGSANVTLNGSLKRCSFYDDSSDWSKYPWRKIANIAVGGSYADNSITFMVTNSWSSPLIGILRAHIRVGGTAGVYEAGQLTWLFLTDTAGTYIKPENFVMVYTNNSGTSLTAEIWVKNAARYNGYMFTVLDESDRKGFRNIWALTTNPTRAASYTSGTGVIISSVSRVLNASQNMTYTELLYSGTGSESVKGLEGLSSYDLFTVIVQDSSAKWENAVVVTPSNYTRFCIPTSPTYNSTSTFTGFVSIGIYVNTSSNAITCYPSKYIIEATSSSSITASTHSRKYPITKVYGHKYYL